LRGDEVVVDAGCGSGRVTAELARRLPRGRVYGVDVSSAMTEHAREALGGRATILCQDLVKLELPEPVDAVFSNATFHWIHDHDALFAALFAALKPGARLVAQCGGRGNIDAFRQIAETVTGDPPFAAYFTHWPAPWNYAGDRETAARLEQVGFADVDTWLEPKRVLPERDFVKTVCLLPHLKQLPSQLHDAFVDRVIERCGDPVVLEYVRLNMTARR
ncbi:MAG: methyltransferase domain-containing protein, partial [Solirubrobacterales bacterium]|nr:methyltransferase domain-containing protein [Solirubrobacterales bacterium]